MSAKPRVIPGAESIDVRRLPVMAGHDGMARFNVSTGRRRVAHWPDD
jgi:hypothetical protein